MAEINSGENNHNPTYREYIFSPGSFCEWRKRYCDWTISEIPLQALYVAPPVILSGTIWAVGSRAKFDSYIRKNIKIQDTQARCHSISYETLIKTIINSINKFIEKNTCTLKKPLIT